jgi:hypothetical protein
MENIRARGYINALIIKNKQTVGLVIETLRDLDLPPIFWIGEARARRGARLSYINWDTGIITLSPNKGWTFTRVDSPNILPILYMAGITPIYIRYDRLDKLFHSRNESFSSSLALTLRLGESNVNN